MQRSMWRGAAVGGALLGGLLESAPAEAQTSEGQAALTLFVGTGPAGVMALRPAAAPELGARGLVDFGACVPLGQESLALVGAARLGLGGLEGAEWGGWLGLRSQFSREGFGTFAELALGVRATPHLSLGPRAAVGAQLELSPAFGLYSALGFHLGFLSGLRADVELTVGALAFFDLATG